MFCSRFSAAVLAVALIAGTCFAQSTSGTITGLISDPSGAVVSGAAVEARSLNTGTIFPAASSATGNYTVAQLPPGPYELTVTVSGFRQYRREGLQMAASQVMRIDISLEVGTTTESVTVTADASLLKTENPATVHNVSVIQLQNLPILPVNGGGVSGGATNGLRDPLALARLLPGVSYSASTQLIVNGNPNNTVNTIVEGQTANLTRMAGTTTQMVQPSTDAVEQVAVLTSNYSAEFGTAGGAVINMTMKSGTNQFHGNAYDYAVNEVLNAAQPYTGRKAKQRRHDFGGTFGGPVLIPKLYNGRNKTFFFFSYERYEEHSFVNTTSATVPLPEYRVGDFSPLIRLSGTSAGPRMLQVGGKDYVDPLGRTYQSGTIFDPNSAQTVVCDKTRFPTANCTAGASYQVRNALPNNQLSPANFDPVSQNILKLVPLPLGPNAAAGLPSSNYQNPWKNDFTTRLPSIKLDHSVNQKGRISGYLQSVRYDAPLIFPNGQALGLPQPIDPGRGAFSRNYTGRLNYDHTVSPTVLMHFGIGFVYEMILLEGPITNYNAEKELGLRGATVNRLFPNITTGVNTALGGMTTLGVTTGLSSNLSSEYRPSANFSTTWVKNNHTFKFGWDWRWEFFPNRSFTGTAGNYTLDASSTQQTALQDQNLSQGNNGFAIASFVLGNANAISMNVPSSDRNQKVQTSLFMQDTWKLTRKLTFDYGLRWDYGTYTRERHGRSAIFSPDVVNASAGGHPGGSIYEATCNCKFANNYPFAFGPRVGLAYQIDTKTVLRGGFGLVYNPTPIAVGATFVSAASGQLGFGEWLYQLKNGRPANINPAWPDFRPNAGHPDNNVIAGAGAVDVNSGRPARQAQWSIGLQREINRNLVVEASYVANRGAWWNAGALSPLNSVSQATLSRYGFQVGNTADSALLRAQFANLTTAQRSTLLSRGVVAPWNGYPANQLVRNSIRAFPQYSGSLDSAGAPLGKTWYDSLQLVVTKRLSRGLTLNANYTYSKSLAAMTSPDPFNRDLAKNIGVNDLPHQFQLAADYHLPHFRQGMLGQRLVSSVLSDWGMGWYLQYQSAGDLARPASAGTDPLSNWLGYGPGSAQLKKNADGSYMNPYAVNWTDYDGKVHAEPLNINCHCFDPQRTVVLNKDAWENIPNGQWANDFTGLRFYRGIRQPNESFNMSRVFRIKEGVNLMVRAEWQNVFNRMRQVQPTTTGFTATPTQVSGVYTGGFGTINPLAGNGLAGQRSGTLIGRITF